MSNTGLIIILAVIGVLIIFGIIMCISLMRGMYRKAGGCKPMKKQADIIEQTENVEEIEDSKEDISE